MPTDHQHRSTDMLNWPTVEPTQLPGLALQAEDRLNSAGSNPHATMHLRSDMAPNSCPHGLGSPTAVAIRCASRFPRRRDGHARYGDLTRSVESSSASRPTLPRARP